MALETRNSANVTYLQLDYGKKSLFIYSKEAAEGYEKHTSTKGNVSYRRYVTAVSGHVTGAFFRENNFGGKDFTLVITDGEEKYYIPIDIASSLFQQIAKSLGSLDVEKRIRLSVFGKEYNGKEYLNVYIGYMDEVDSDGKMKTPEWVELPKGKQLKSGKWDFTELQDETYTIAEEFISKNNFDKVSSPKPADTNTNQAVEETQSVQEVDDDDLPF